MSDRKAIERRLASYRQRLRLAAARLDIGSVIDRKSLALAGEFFDLDPKNSIMREMLLYVLADVLFGPRKKGRPRASNTAWHFHRYFELCLLYLSAKHDNPKLSDAKIAELICEHEEFKNNDPEQVRQHITRSVREFREHEQRRRELTPRLKKSEKRLSSV